MKTIAGDFVLFHGSATPEIRELRVAEEDTVGSGVYFTPDFQSALGYAITRAGNIVGGRYYNGEVPIVYEAAVGCRFVDLRDQYTLDLVFDGYVNVLKNKLEGVPNQDWLRKRVLSKSIERIQTRQYSPGCIQHVTRSNGQMFSNYLRSSGFDGLIGEEGGEAYVGDHESWVVFDPAKPKITKENVFDRKDLVGFKHTSSEELAERKKSWRKLAQPEWAQPMVR